MLRTSLTAIAGAFLSFSAVAHNFDPDPKTIECYDLPNGENGKGSRNSVYIPPFKIAGGNRRHWIGVTNIGAKAVNVRLTLFNAQGEAYTPTDYVLLEEFDEGNAPVPGSATNGVGLLSSFETGIIRLHENEYPGALSGVLTWQTNACLTKPTMTVTIYSISSSSNTNGRFRSQSAVVVNGGNPF